MKGQVKQACFEKYEFPHKYVKCENAFWANYDLLPFKKQMLLSWWNGYIYYFSSILELNLGPEETFIWAVVARELYPIVKIRQMRYSAQIKDHENLQNLSILLG